MKIAKLPWHGLLILLRRCVVDAMIFASILLWGACGLTVVILIFFGFFSVLVGVPLPFHLYGWVAFAGFISPLVWIFARNSLNEARTIEKEIKEMRKTARKADAENFNGD